MVNIWTVLKWRLSDGTSYKTTTDVKGYYHFDKTKILGATTYDIKISKKGYWERGNTAKQTTVGLTENTDLKQDFTLEPIPKEPIVLPEILYDLAKWDLKPQYKDSLPQCAERPRPDPDTCCMTA